MGINEKFRSEDGHYYDSLIEATDASRAWREQRKEQREQNQLLMEQNLLIAEENRRREELAQQQLEQQRLELDKKLEHEEKMRILKLFDSIGLNKQYYDLFLEYLIDDNIVKLKQSLDNLKEEKENIEKIILPIIQNIVLNKGLRKFPEELKWLEDSQYDDEISEEIEKIFEWINKIYDKCRIPSNIKLELKNKLQNCLNNFSKINTITEEDLENFTYEKEFEVGKNDLQITKKLLIIFIIVFTIGIALNSVWLVLIFLILIIIGCNDVYSKKKYIRDTLELEIKHMNCEEVDFSKVCKEFDKSKIRCEKRLKDLDIQIQTKQADILKELLPKWNDFVDFRKKHYNSQFENLLLDLELKDKIEEMGIEYCKINNNNKTSNGTIDDYIAYFDGLQE